VPGTSIGYQKHLLSLKVMTAQTEQGPWSFTGSFGPHGNPWVNLFPFFLFYFLKKLGTKSGTRCSIKNLVLFIIIYYFTWQRFQHPASCHLLLPHFGQAVFHPFCSPQKIKYSQVMNHAFWCKHLERKAEKNNLYSCL